MESFVNLGVKKELSKEELLKAYNIEEYLKDLQKINEQCLKIDPAKRGQWWKDAVKRYFSKVFDDVLKRYKIEPGTYNYSLCICGSLAKGQATPFSDLDSFIITDLDTTTKALQPVVDELFNVFDIIFEESNQLCMDPIGINPKKFIGTPDELTQKIVSGNVADVDSFYNSVLSAAYVYGVEDKKLETFQQKLSEAYASHQKPTPEALAIRYYEQATKEFKGVARPEKVNIKKDFFRPLDFILMGLRMEAGIQHDLQGSHLNASTLIKKLRAKGKVSDEVVALVENIYQKAMNLRFTAHVLAGKEEDDKSLVIDIEKKEDLVPNQKESKEKDNSDKKSKEENVVAPQMMEQMEVAEQVPNKDKKAKEEKEAEIRELRTLIDQVAILRGITAERVKMLNNGVPANKLPVFSCDFLNPKFADQTFKVSEMVFNPKEMVEELIVKSQEDRAEQAYWMGVANALNRREFFIKALVDMEQIANGLAHLDFKEKVQKLLNCLRNIPIEQSQIHQFELFAQSMLKLLNKFNPVEEKRSEPTVEDFCEYEKNFAKLRILQPSIPDIDIVSNIRIDVYTKLIGKLGEAENKTQAQVNKDSNFNEEISKIKRRRDKAPKKVNEPIADYKDLIRILCRYIQNTPSETPNSAVRIKDPRPDWMNVVRGLNHLETYITRTQSGIQSFVHTKRNLFSSYMKEMEEALASRGLDEAVARLFERYRKSLSKEPKSLGTTILGQSLAIALGFELKDLNGLDRYELYKLLMKRISYPTDLATTLNDCAENEITSPSYKLSRQKTKEKKEESATVLQNAALELSKHESITDFNFSKEAWKKLDKDKMQSAQMRALLEVELEKACNIDLSTSYENSRLEKDKSKSILEAIKGIGRAQSQITNFQLIRNEEIAQILRIVKFASEITSSPDPTSDGMADQRKQLRVMIRDIKTNFYLQDFYPHLKVIADGKEKIIKKINKKLAEWHPWKYEEKREALLSLRRLIEGANNNKTFGEVLDVDWGSARGNDEGETNNQIIGHKRWSFFSRRPANDGQGNKKPTTTEKFINELRDKYKDVKFKR